MSTLVGIDEVGRGCWAGPLLVVAAQPKSILPFGLADSKILTKKVRNALVEIIVESCDLGEGWVEPREIDELGLTQAMKLGVLRALTALGTKTDATVVLDGSFNYCPSDFTNVRCMVNADAIVPIVSAASIYAKVTRDRYMAEQAKKYPDYSFEKHVGYGTAMHMAALKKHGICDLHRLSYKPVKALLV